MKKIWQVVAQGTKELKKAEIVNAGLESSLLMRWLLTIDAKKLLMLKQEELSEKQIEGYFSLISLRKTGYPLQYIIGRQEFMGLDFKVTPDVLIPRGDTEVLIEKILVTDLKEDVVAVDVGTGSGALAISLAVFKKGWKVYALDNSNKALAVARENAERLNAEVTFLEGDLLEPLKELAIKADLVVSNPPYIPSADIIGLMKEVAFEPFAALDGGKEGLDYYKKIIPDSFNILIENGLLVLEIGIRQSEQVCELCKRAGFEDIKVFNDYQGLPRAIFAQKK